MSLWQSPALLNRFRWLASKSEQSFSEIAASLTTEFGLSVSRSACVAKAHRLGIKRGRAMQPYNGLARKRAALAQRLRSAIPTKPPNTSDHPVTLMDVEPHQCRWPVDPREDGVFLFCGDAQVEGHSYCPRHCLSAYQFREGLAA